MTRDEIALRIFCALMSRPDAKVELYPNLGEKQIRTCFLIADVFLKTANEGQKNPPPPEDTGGMVRRGWGG